MRHLRKKPDGIRNGNLKKRETRVDKSGYVLRFNRNMEAARRGTRAEEAKVES